MNYRNNLLALRDAYFKRLGDATQDERFAAMVAECSVAEDVLDAFVNLDFTHSYNYGDAVDSLEGESKKNYIKFLEAFGLKDPKGIKPKIMFELPESDYNQSEYEVDVPVLNTNNNGRSTVTTYTPRLDSAIRKAAWAHRHQIRKDTELPYIIHPFGVMLIASEATNDEDILIACLFHDILEDVPDEYSEEQMTSEYGQRVVDIVKDVTKDSTLSSWEERSEAYLHHLEHETSDESVLVSAADKLHNLTSILVDYEEIGDDIWNRFNADKDKQLWWYESVYAVIEKRLPNLTFLPNYKANLHKLQCIVTGK